jgi:hypothetical protein
MSLTTQQLVDELRIHLGVDDNDLSDSDAVLLVNRSYWELIDKFPFREKETTATFTTTIGERNYTVPSPFEAVRQLSIVEPDLNKLIVLQRQTIFGHESSRSTDSDDEGFPTHYLREKNLIRLYPIPDKVYTITVKYWTTLADLDTSTSNPLLPQNWHEIVLYGSCWRAALRFRDTDQYNMFRSEHAAMINTAVPVESKEEIDTRFARVQVYGRDYDYD